MDHQPLEGLPALISHPLFAEIFDFKFLNQEASEIQPGVCVFEVKNEIPIYLPQKAILDKYESGLATLPTARRIFLKHLCLYAEVFLLLVSAGCTQQQGSPPTRRRKRPQQVLLRPPQPPRGAYRTLK
jgi:hypothetical protein